MLKGHLPRVIYHQVYLSIRRVMADALPVSSEHGTCKTVKARFWPWLSGILVYEHKSGRTGYGRENELRRDSRGAPALEGRDGTLETPIFVHCLCATTDHSEISYTGSCTGGYSSRFKNKYCAEMCSGSEAGSYLRPIDFFITQH